MTGVRRGPIDGLLDEVWRSVAAIGDGEVATYIPELAKADPATFGLGLATLDGQVYTAGELVPFTIQSVSKPFVYALALADQGHDAVLAKVGTEPTGDPFNSISIDDATGRASNPMVNAGAIITTSFVSGATRCSSPSARRATVTARSRGSCARPVCSTTTSTRRSTSTSGSARSS
jgi:glutaminase